MQEIDFFRSRIDAMIYFVRPLGGAGDALAVEPDRNSGSSEVRASESGRRNPQSPGHVRQHRDRDWRRSLCWLQGALGDALHSISCAAGYNLRWLLRAIARLGIGAVFLRLWQAALSQRRAIGRSYSTLGRVWMESLSNWSSSAVVKKRFLVTPCRVLFENRILHGRLFISDRCCAH